MGTIKIMVWLDGSWIYSNTTRLGDACGKENFHLDFGLLPGMLARQLEENIGMEVLVVRTHLFGSYATNYHLQDKELVDRRLDFFHRLKEEHHYEVETFPINFRGRRLRRMDRDPGDPFYPKEKCVDISLAASMMYNAALPNAYDIAVAVVGDQDFKPVFQAVRHLGKRVAIASIKGSCTPEFSNTLDPARVKDFDIIWLDDHLDELELKYTEHTLECESTIHEGDRRIQTTFYPRKVQQFFCDKCRSVYKEEDYSRSLLIEHTEDVR